jgi:hypothetical protein
MNMAFRTALIVLALALAGCNQQGSNDGAQDSAALDTPAPESQPDSVYTPNNDAARNTTGQLTMSVALRLPDAGSENADQQEVLTLRGASGLVVEAAITGALSPATQVEGQTLRALLDMPVDEPQVLVYRVTNETKPEGVGGLCGGEAAAYVVVWEPSAPGASSMRLLGTRGGAPGAASARACPMLDYGRGG